VNALVLLIRIRAEIELGRVCPFPFVWLEYLLVKFCPAISYMVWCQWRWAENEWLPDPMETKERSCVLGVAYDSDDDGHSQNTEVRVVRS